MLRKKYSTEELVIVEFLRMYNVDTLVDRPWVHTEQKKLLCK